MSERATVHNRSVLGVEATAGTAVAATKRLQSVSFEPAIDPTIAVFGPTGTVFDTVTALNAEMVSVDISGIATYTEAPYLLCGALKAVTPTLDGTLPYKWVVSPSQSAPDTVKTYTIEQGSGVRAHKWSYGLLTDLGYTFNRQSIEVSGKMIGKALSDDITLTGETQTVTITGAPTDGTFTLTFRGQTTGDIDYNAASADVQTALEALSSIGTGNVTCTGGALPGTAVVCTFGGDLGGEDVDLMTADSTDLSGGTTPTVTVTETTAGPAALDLVPTTGSQWQVFLATPAATPSFGTALARVTSAEWQVTGRFGPVWVANASTSFAGHVTLKPTGTVKLKMEADDEGMALLATMRANSTKIIRIQAEGAEIETGKKYLLQLDTAGKVESVAKFEDQDGLYAIEWTFRWVYDATWGKVCEVTNRNKLSAL